MSDWKRVAATCANAFAVATHADKTVRTVFGETLGKPEDVTFHGAALVNRADAKLLADLILNALAQPESYWGGVMTATGGGSIH